LFLWVGALQIMLDKGKDLDWFNSPTIVILLLITGIGFAAWLIWELTDQHPVVDLSLFKSRNLATSQAHTATLKSRPESCFASDR
jgi:DHA2 family multidrug resistance protein